MIVNCTTRSNSVPASHTQPMRCKWYVDGANITSNGKYQSSLTRLELSGVTRSDDGVKISCVAEETSELPSNTSLDYSVRIECRYIYIYMCVCVFSQSLTSNILNDHALHLHL